MDDVRTVGALDGAEHWARWAAGSDLRGARVIITRGDARADDVVAASEGASCVWLVVVGVREGDGRGDGPWAPTRPCLAPEARAALELAGHRVWPGTFCVPESAVLEPCWRAALDAEAAALTSASTSWRAPALDAATLRRMWRVWFGVGDHDVRRGAECASAWFRKDAAFDDWLRAVFGAVHARAAAGRLAVDRGDPLQVVSAVLLLDQISRNIHRDTPAAFAQDEAARQWAHASIVSGLDAHPALAHEPRVFLMMPLMHSESLDDHDVARERFGTIAELGRGTPLETRLAMVADYEEKHRVIVERFGRYPHRNAVIGRESTAEELTFLEEPGSSF